MSEYLIKSETLQDIANALREKTGETGTFKVQDFATEIREIQSGGGDIDALIEGTLTEVTSNVTSIGQYAFYYSDKLTSVNFPNVTSIGRSAFASCSLTTVDFPNATSIGDYAFAACRALKTVDFPLATSTGNYSFNNCENLTTANIPNATSIGNSAFVACRVLKTVNIPNATSIGNSAFSGCNYGLKTVDFPNATSIGNSAFENCYSLTKLIIGTDNTTSPTLSNTNAFKNCYHITGTVNASHNPEGLKDGYIYVKADMVAETRTKTNWVTYATQIMPWVATVEELSNIDGTTYDHACVGEGVDSIEYIYDGDSWRIFR